MAIRSAMRIPRRRKLTLAALFAIVVAVVVGVWIAKRGGIEARAPGSMQAREEFPPPEELPWPESPYLNARPEVQYVGSDACRECHPGAFETYLATAHSRSLRRTVPDAEPADTAFVHEPSQRRYEVYREGAELRHREVLLLPGSEELQSHDHCIDYTVGSGRLGWSYVAEIDGFLVQSPVTWRAARERWGMSPGYEGSRHASFLRSLRDECFFCHAGKMSRSEGNVTRLGFQEMSIGCERCHGPGSLHVARHRSGDWSGSEPDMTIVNPARLSQDRQESVCAQCHLHNDADVVVRGRQIDDFRPGLPLDQFRVDYWLQEPDEGMSVAGHYGQLHQSRCHTASDGMSCLTCHDPHEAIPQEERVAHFRSACLSCHQQDACGLPNEERMQQAANDCVRCHMPKSATEVPHVAFTHHRIGIHSPGTTETRQSSGSAAGEFVLAEEPDLPDVERARLRGLAHFMQLKKEARGPAREHHHRRAKQLLDEALEGGAGDAPVRAALAELAMEQLDSGRATRLARSVVNESQGATREWVQAARVLAELAFARREFESARDLYRELAEARYDASYWFYLGICEQNCGDTEAATRALEKSLEIDPIQTGAHDVLAILHQTQGKRASEAAHRKASAVIQKFLRQLPSSDRRDPASVGLSSEQD